MPSGRLSNGPAQSHGFAEPNLHNVHPKDYRAHRNGFLCDAQEVQSDFQVTRIPSCEYDGNGLFNGEICWRLVISLFDIF